MKLTALILSMLLTGCISNKSRTSDNLATSEDDSSGFADVLGCYAVNTVRDEKAAPKTVATLYAKTDQICIKSTPQGYTGTHAFEMRTNNKIISTIGYNMPDEQPRCPKCYSFSGLQGTADYSGNLRNRQVNLKIVFAHDKSALSIEMEKIDTSAPPMSCTKTIDEASKHMLTMEMSNDRKQLTIKQASSTGEFQDEVYALAQVQLTAEPTSQVIHECVDGARVMKLWKTNFRFDSMYFRVKKL